MTDENMIATNSCATADDLRAKVHELFAKCMGNLDPNLDKLIKSGCGIVEDHEKLGGYATAKLFLIAFLAEEADNVLIPYRVKSRYRKIVRNYRLFL